LRRTPAKGGGRSNAFYQYRVCRRIADQRRLRSPSPKRCDKISLHGRQDAARSPRPEAGDPDRAGPIRIGTIRAQQLTERFHAGRRPLGFIGAVSRKAAAHARPYFQHRRRRRHVSASGHRRGDAAVRAWRCFGIRRRDSFLGLLGIRRRPTAACSASRRSARPNALEGLALPFEIAARLIGHRGRWSPRLRGIEETDRRKRTLWLVRKTEPRRTQPNRIVHESTAVFGEAREICWRVFT